LNCTSLSLSLSLLVIWIENKQGLCKICPKYDMQIFWETLVELHFWSIISSSTFIYVLMLPELSC
jgi:hypothetical protein